MSTFPGAFVPVAPPADGLRLAFVAARRRRNRKAGATGAAGLLAAVALLASTGGAGQPTLMQEPLPPSSSTGLGVLPGADPTAAPGRTAPPAAASSLAVVSTRRAQVADPQAHDTVRSDLTSAGTSSRNGVSAQGTKPVSGPMTRGSSVLYTNGDLMCPARKQQEGQRGLCTDIYASQNPSTGDTTITAEICNVGTATEVLSYETARELDLSVRRSGIEVWRWSIGRHFAATPHQLAIGTQACINWSTTWAQVDSHGGRVQAGGYDVVADFDAAEVAAADRHPSYPITISQQP
jgi:hypothetical protein